MDEIQLLNQISDQIKTISEQVDQVRTTNENVGKILVHLVNLLFGVMLGACAGLGVTRAWKS